MTDGAEHGTSRPSVCLIRAGLLTGAMLLLSACGGAEDPWIDTTDTLAMAGADEWLEQDSRQGAAHDHAVQAPNQSSM